MEREQDFDNEIEIDLKDLFLEIISYWQWIILVTIATGAFLRSKGISGSVEPF